MTLSFADSMADPKSYLPPAPQERVTGSARPPATTEATPAIADDASFQLHVDAVIDYLKAQGFVFEPWQVGAFITAVRTKPFVILAGISGTGKTKLPRLVADATAAECHTVPVRPDWTDSSELLGYERLNGNFRPGELLRFAREAQQHPETQHFFVLDEMNIARVEYYLAEVLSHLEERRPDEHGRVVSEPLVRNVGDMAGGAGWDDVRLPDNLCIVGSVNMDETTYGFSKKVLDRAFVIEFSTIDLSEVGGVEARQPVLTPWPSAAWRAQALSLAAHPERHDESVAAMIETLTRVNEVLRLGQLQFGYRVRDEIVMFCLAAQQCAATFTTAEMGTVDPLDLAIAMKVLPRIQGGGATIGKVLAGLHAWAAPDTAGTTNEPGSGENVGFPFCAARLALMQTRLRESGFTNYWL